MALHAGDPRSGSSSIVSTANTVINATLAELDGWEVAPHGGKDDQDELFRALWARDKFSTKSIALFWTALLRKHENEMHENYNWILWTFKLLQADFDSTDEFLNELSELDIKHGLPHLLEHLIGKGLLQRTEEDVLRIFHERVKSTLSDFDSPISLENVSSKTNSQGVTVQTALAQCAALLPRSQEGKIIRQASQKMLMLNRSLRTTLEVDNLKMIGEDMCEKYVNLKQDAPRTEVQRLAAQLEQVIPAETSQ